VGGQARLKVGRLYPAAADMTKLVQDDEARFLATRDKRNEEMKKAFDEPSFKPAGTTIKSKPDSLFALELLVTTKD
jgi:hypothetical protein